MLKLLAQKQLIADIQCNHYDKKVHLIISDAESDMCIFLCSIYDHLESAFADKKNDIMFLIGLLKNVN